MSDRLLSRRRAERSPWAGPIPDPMDPDAPAEEPAPVTLRQLSRLALVASEVGARFQREGIDHDPMAWMFAPRRLFGGRCAMEATLDLEHCTRAILLHGMGMLDMDPRFIDALCADDEDTALDAIGDTAA